ncbi:MAG: HAMP domain-containing histidine kinase [Deltaproteobacteria bacterium]|nr:HAMP domain-containing histidine kinase [Deltaproteobacteria bacterium]
MRRQASNASPGPEAQDSAPAVPPGDDAASSGGTTAPGAAVPPPPEPQAGAAQAGGASEAPQGSAAAQAQRGEPQVSQIPRWAVEANVRANDIARQIEVANTGDVTTQQQLQNDFNMMRGLPQQQAAPPPAAPPVAVAPPPPAPAVPAAPEADAGQPGDPDGRTAATAGSDDAGAVEPVADADRDAAEDRGRTARSRDQGRRDASTTAADETPDAPSGPNRGLLGGGAAESLRGQAAAAATPEPRPEGRGSVAENSSGGLDDVPVVYGAFEPLAGPDGSRYYVRTVDIEGDVRVQGFRLNPGGLRATLGNVVLDVQRSHDAFDLVAGGALPGPGATALAAATLEGVPDVPRIAAILRPGSPALDAEDREDRRVLLILGGLSAVIAVAVLLSVLVLRRELELAQRRSDFLSAVSHELRAPVTTIRMYAEMLRDGWVDDAVRRSEYESAIVSEGERLSRLVENVLAYSRRERGKPLAFRDADLAEKVREVAGVQRPVFERDKLELAVEAPETLPWRFDPDAVTQILVNLLDNALKHSRDAAERRVLVRLSGAPDAATLAVRDHGPGVAAGEQKRIFEAFYRVGSELTRETRGTGLGLALVRRLARAHGGDVSVASAPGEGATFTVTLGKPR